MRRGIALLVRRARAIRHTRRAAGLRPRRDREHALRPDGLPETRPRRGLLRRAVRTYATVPATPGRLECVVRKLVGGSERGLDRPRGVFVRHLLVRRACGKLDGERCAFWAPSEKEHR